VPDVLSTSTPSSGAPAIASAEWPAPAGITIRDLHWRDVRKLLAERLIAHVGAVHLLKQGGSRLSADGQPLKPREPFLLCSCRPRRGICPTAAAIRYPRASEP
jgi:hypothetical protein